MKKKILLLLLIILSTIIVNAKVEYFGDVDDNGKIGASDYILIRKHIVGTRELVDRELKRADVNRDNKISSSDYISIKKIIVNGLTPEELPPEFEYVEIPTKDLCVTKTYNGKDQQLITTISTSGYVLSNYTGKDAGEYTITAKLSQGYKWADKTDTDKTFKCSIDKAANAINLTKKTYTYDGGGKAATVTATYGTPAVTYYSDASCNTKTTTANATAAGGTPKNAGTYYAKATVDASTNYKAESTGCKEAVVITRQYTVTYKPNGGSGSNVSQNITYNTDWTTKDKIFTRDGYELVGWSTTASGGVTHNLNKAQGKWTNASHLTLYAVWNKVSSYVITEDSKYDGYTNVAEYNSATLKYRIIKYQEQDIVLIYVADPYMQLNGALATSDALHSLKAEDILANEIKKYSYEKKGMIAVNASFYSPTNNYNGTPWDGVVINHGKVVKDTGITGAAFGILPNGMLKTYWKETATKLSSEGIRNTFVFSSDTARDSSTVKTNRTQICQYDKNNFVLLSGKGMVRACGEQITTLTGCKTPYNLDGGDSRKLYYKTSGSSEMTKRYGSSRVIPDMLYFVEK